MNKSHDPLSAIAPDTTGLNFYTADRSLSDLLDIYVEPALRRHIEPHLVELGALAGGRLDECARLADRHTPILHTRNRFGDDVQTIEYHPAYRELEAAGFGRFGIHAMSHRGGILGWPKPYSTPAKHAFTYLFNQAEFGMGCPLNVTDGAAMLLDRYGAPELKAKYLENLITTDMARLTQGAQFMTEKEGGSDVGRLTSRAVREGDHWRLYGDKWFCSNADGGIAMLLARPQGAPQGTRGVGLFLMPRVLDDGTPNHYRIVRLKDKLGTRSMASGEIKLEGAIAYEVGAIERGFVQMAEMVNWSRLSNGVKSTALMRRALHDSLTVAKNRKVFGKLIVEHPLARRQLMKIMLPVEQALSLSFMTADALERAEVGRSQAAATLVRVLTPVLKYRSTRDARKVTGDALEMRGGIGYVEEFATPRLLRDAHLGSIWEGTGNIVSLDTVQRAIGRHGAEGALADELHARVSEAKIVPKQFADTLKRHVDASIAFARTVAKTPDLEADARRATSMLYHVSSAVMMAWEAGRIHEARGDAKRLLLARLVVDHKIGAPDPYRPSSSARDDAIARHLLSDEAVSRDTATELVGA